MELYAASRQQLLRSYLIHRGTEGTEDGRKEGRIFMLLQDNSCLGLNSFIEVKSEGRMEGRKEGREEGRNFMPLQDNSC